MGEVKKIAAFPIRKDRFRNKIYPQVFHIGNVKIQYFENQLDLQLIILIGFYFNKGFRHKKWNMYSWVKNQSTLQLHTGQPQIQNNKQLHIHPKF